MAEDETLPPNEAPDFALFCEQLKNPDNQAIRFFGGFALTPRKDNALGSCEVPMNLLDKLDSGLAPLQPFLKVLDIVATLCQVVLLIPGCITNPFKIPQLLSLLPGLVQKLNDLLSLIPALPQGVVTVVQMVYDTLVLTINILDCVIKTLESIQQQIDEITNLLLKVNETRDDSIKEQLEIAAKCAQDNAAVQVGTALRSLEVIARVLCTIRSILSLVPGGRSIAKEMALPDPTGIVDLGSAIEKLEEVKAVLEPILALIEALAGGLSLALPDPTFSCPAVDDIPDDDVPVEPPPEPTVARITSPEDPPISQYYPAPSVPIVLPFVTTWTVLINGTNFAKTSKVFLGADLIPVSNVDFVSSMRMIVRIPAAYGTDPSTQQLAVVNEGNIPTSAGGLPSFSGIQEKQPPLNGDENVKVSNQARIEFS